MKPAEITIADFILRLGMAALVGTAIGFERQWRHRAAGLHTSSLVAVGAALFALLDTVIGRADTTRIVAGIVTGVGFIAGGVILKSGSNITGLNTAATMWATAGVGALAGFGLWWEACAGSAAIVLLNLLLQPAADAIDLRSRRLQVGEVTYTISLVCDEQSRSAVSEAMLKAVSNAAISLQSLKHERADGRELSINADILSPRPDEATIEAVASTLLSITGVRRCDWRASSAR
jgi:putative Mg2+ transporter-C (MgtC) family protein